MKNLLFILVAFITFVISNETIAQFTIPSYNVEIVAEPTTFEESGNQVSVFSQINHRKPLLIQTQNSDEERKIHVKVSSSDPEQSAYATVLIYSLDEEYVLGPFYVTDESILEQSIDNRDWGVEVVSASENCKISTWIE